MHLRTGVRLSISAFALVFGLAEGAAYGQSTRTVINAATNTSYPPYKFKDPADNKLKGFAIDLLEAMAAKMGAKVNWTEASFNQMLSSISTKRADVITDIADTPERRESMNFLDFAIDYSVFFILRDNIERFPNAEALCGKRVATERATTWPVQIAKWSDEHCISAGKSAINLVGTDSQADTLLQLKQGRVDASASGAGTLAYQNTLDNNRYLSVAKLNQGEIVGYGFAKDDLQFGHELKDALAAVMADGTYDDLIRKWNLPPDDAIERPMINGQP